jgi:hypothetical protein
VTGPGQRGALPGYAADTAAQFEQAQVYALVVLGQL